MSLIPSLEQTSWVIIGQYVTSKPTPYFYQEMLYTMYLHTVLLMFLQTLMNVNPRCRTIAIYTRSAQTQKARMSAAAREDTKEMESFAKVQCAIIVHYVRWGVLSPLTFELSSIENSQKDGSARLLQTTVALGKYSVTK